MLKADEVVPLEDVQVCVQRECMQAVTCTLSTGPGPLKATYAKRGNDMTHLIRAPLIVAVNSML